MTMSSTQSLLQNTFAIRKQSEEEREKKQRSQANDALSYAFQKLVHNPDITNNALAKGKLVRSFITGSTSDSSVLTRFLNRIFPAKMMPIEPEMVKNNEDFQNYKDIIKDQGFDVEATIKNRFQISRGEEKWLSIANGALLSLVALSEGQALSSGSFTGLLFCTLFYQGIGRFSYGNVMYPESCTRIEMEISPQSELSADPA